MSGPAKNPPLLPLTPALRQAFITMGDEELLRQCRVDVYRGTGPGGQKRNRTESAVRLTHTRTGVVAACDETRSQHTNRQIALRKLRCEIALLCRCLPAVPYTGTWAPGAKSADYPGWMAAVLDHLETQQFRLSEAAALLGVSTGQLVRAIASDDDLWQMANQGRARCGHPPLRHP